MLKCKSANLTTCGRPIETALTRFEMFSLSGTFGTKYVFPEVLLSKIHLSPEKFEVRGFKEYISLLCSLKSSKTD
jgi:pantetheine hydrolase